MAVTLSAALSVSAVLAGPPRAWVASAIRTLLLDAGLAPASRGRAPTVVQLAWPNKSPRDLDDYSLDCGAWLADAQDTLISVTAYASPTDLVLASVSFASGLITVWLSGGTVGNTYGVEIHAITLAGRVLDRVVWITVAALYTNSTAASPGVTLAMGPPGPPGPQGPAGSAGGGGGAAISGIALDGNGSLVLTAIGAAPVSSAPLPIVALKGNTSGTTPATLSLDGTTATAAASLVIPTGIIVQTAVGRVTAQDQVSGDMAVWDVAFAIKRATSGGSPVVVGTPFVSIFAADASLTTCAVAITVGSGNILITVTGLAARSIHWSAALTIVHGT